MQLGDGEKVRVFRLLTRQLVAESQILRPKNSFNCIEPLQAEKNCLTFGIGDKMGSVQVWQLEVEVQNQQQLVLTQQRKILSTLLWVLTIAPVPSQSTRDEELTSNLVAAGGSFSRFSP